MGKTIIALGLAGAMATTIGAPSYAGPDDYCGTDCEGCGT